MSIDASTIPATDVHIGDRIRTRGLELTVTRIDVNFFGTDMLAFVEDSEEQWIKVPTHLTDDVEVLARGIGNPTASTIWNPSATL